jgi:tetratricopeptide (TPR) repeat protein
MEAPQFLKRLLGLRDPRRAAAFVAKGVVLARQNDLQGALGCYRRALGADDTYALAHLNVALALQDLYNARRAEMGVDETQRQLEEMAEHLRLSGELDPKLSPAHRARGFVERARHHYPEARTAFAAYLATTAGDDPRRGEIERCLAEVAEAADLDALLASGISAAEKVSTLAPAARAEAITALMSALSKDALRADGWWALGVLRRAEGEMALAQEALLKTLEVEPRHINAHRELASLHFYGGEPDKALPHAHAAYVADPTNAAAVCNVGVCHLSMGNLRDAREFIELAMGIAPKDPIVQEAVKAVQEAVRTRQESAS